MLKEIKALAGELAGMPELVRASSLELRRVPSLCGGALLSALGVLLNFFTLSFGPFFRLGFFFLPVGVSGMLFGPVLTGTLGVATDLLKYFTMSFGQPYFVGYTFGEFVRGFLFGLILYKKPVTVKRILAAKLVDTVVNNLILGPLWLSMMYGESFTVLVSMRLVKNLLMLPVETALLYQLCKKAAQMYGKRQAF